MGHAVTLYRKEGCALCAQVKDFLARHRVEYADRNVTTDSHAEREAAAKGYTSLPVTEVDGETIPGLAWDQLLRALGLS